ncbi:AzlD domain-containing protein [Paenibacillus sp. IHBB 10380]|uniref:AzlD domain-containing protein n=1 Tax=Paenibacillus sp. IHBB 10380 TaxID=1566358 RepID=UPI0005CF979F|nr:AzlD domain-containing protein [Paenibacillus sp. IHBB 10380]AJS58793.1 branched-chain amino acid ABC transporter [Paenibacillus sp. IHBB 10380]
MEIRWNILIIILGSALVTFIPRVLPLVVLSRMQLPNGLIRWLQHIPVAVMSALIAQELFIADGHFSLVVTRLEWLAAIPTFAVALMTRSLLGTVLVGLVCMMFLRWAF